MKQLVALGLFLLIMTRESEERTIEDTPMVNDSLRDDSSDNSLEIVIPKQDNFLESDEHLQSLLRNAARKRRSPSDHHGHKNLVENILQEIHKGHLTQEKVDHWWKEIQSALHNGDITMNDVQTLINALKSTSSESGEGCCWFG